MFISDGFIENGRDVLLAVPKCRAQYHHSILYTFLTYLITTGSTRRAQTSEVTALLFSVKLQLSCELAYTTETTGFTVLPSIAIPPKMHCVVKTGPK